MNKILTIAFCAFVLTSGTARAADKVTLQLKWVAQTQFAGYYVAQAKGFYRRASLDVTIKPGGPDINPSQVLANRGADVIVDWMPSALAAREKGVPEVNVAQVFQRSGMELTCRNDSGVRTPADFKGKTLGVWFSGNEYPFLSWMSKLGYGTNGGPDGVTVLKQGFNVDPLLQKKAACISTMTYNEYWQLIEDGMKPSQLTVFKYDTEGVATLEDGLYTTDAKLQDPAEVDRLARFLKASMRGWSYAVTHQDEAVKIVLAAGAPGGRNAAHQARQLSEVAKLIASSGHGLGYLDEAAANRTVRVLLAGSSVPVITKRPSGAWSHVVWQRAFRPAIVSRTRADVHPAACARLVLTGHPSYPPVSWANGATLDGAGIDVVRKLAARSGVPVEVVNEGSWDAAQQAVRSGKADAIVGIYRTQAREAAFDYVLPAIAPDPSAVLVRAGSPFVYHSWESLIGLRGAVSEGEAYGPKFDAFMKDKLTTRRVPGFTAVYQAVTDGKADYGLVGYYAALADTPKHKIKIATPNVVTENLYLAFGKNSPCSRALAASFSRELVTLIGNGIPKKLFNAALAREPSSTRP